jgi:hypothetical protein
MKLEELMEGKTKRKKPMAPRAEHLTKVLRGRKGGAMRDKKKDYVRAKEKQKTRKEMNENGAFAGQDPFELYRDSREHIRESINHLNRILGSHYDRGPRYEHPDRDTLHRLAKAASIVDNAAHTLAAGTPDDKQDPMDE